MTRISRSAFYLTCAAATSEGVPSGMAAVGCNGVACRRAERVLEHSWTSPCLLGASAPLARKAHQQNQSHSRRSQDLLRCSWQTGAGHLVALHGFGDVCTGLVCMEMIAETAAYCARLSDRENALLQYGQT
jgi:hypothetical protein